MTDWGPALVSLGYGNQDWGPGWNKSYASLSGGWRGTVACPSESALLAASAIDDLAKAKKKRIKDVEDLCDVKIKLGWVMGGKTYQCHGNHFENMRTYIAAWSYFSAETPKWLTSTAYVVGDIRQDTQIFYKCLADHTSGTLATDIASGNWGIWYFHPHKGGDGKWRDVDNAMIARTSKQAKTLCEDAINYHQACLAQIPIKKDAINALSTVSAVEGYDITTNWPSNS